LSMGFTSAVKLTGLPLVKNNHIRRPEIRMAMTGR